MKKMKKRAIEKALDRIRRGIVGRGTMPPPTIQHRDVTRYSRKQKHKKGL